MNPQQLFLKIAKRLLDCPVAPFHEASASGAVKEICAEYRLPWKSDGAGNLLVTLKTDARARPLVLAAHMDHPGFEILGRQGNRQFKARFLGSVPPAYFKRGVPIRLLPMEQKGRLLTGIDRAKRCLVAAQEPIPMKPEYAVWDLPEFQVNQHRITGRSCDDLIGVAAALTTLIVLKQKRAKAHVIAAISRAEEVGFNGALVMAEERAFPRAALVISLETSRELVPGQMGAGAIIRVGDRASIFDSSATRFLMETALACQKRNPEFRSQRALMSGGTCEATAYQEFGYQSAALCIALGNYHNCGPKNRIAAEYVDLLDALSMVELLVTAARQISRYEDYCGRLPRRLHRLLASAKRRLIRRG